MKTTKFAPQDVKKIADLAHIPVTADEEKKLADGFNTTIAVVEELFKVEAKGIEPTHQVTGLENVLREDEVKPTQSLTQEEALSNAPRTHNGFFVVDRILDE